MQNRRQKGARVTTRPWTLRPWTTGFDRAARELNAVLLVMAIGLAVLDLTCFCALKMRDALPSLARAAANPALVAAPAPLPLGASTSGFNSKSAPGITAW
jgi:hypothetical protein